MSTQIVEVDIFIFQPASFYTCQVSYSQRTISYEKKNLKSELPRNRKPFTFRLFPAKFSHSKWTRSFSPSMQPILLWGKFKTRSWVSLATPIIRTSRLLATDSCEKETLLFLETNMYVHTYYFHIMVDGQTLPNTQNKFIFLHIVFTPITYSITTGVCCSNQQKI